MNRASQRGLSLQSVLVLAACLSCYITLQLSNQPSFRRLQDDADADAASILPKQQFTHFLLTSDNFSINDSSNSSSGPVVSGSSNHYWQRVYYRGNTQQNNCSSDIPHAISMYENGCAAGPVIDCLPDKLAECNRTEKMMQTDAMMALASGQAFQFFLPEGDHEANVAVVLDRSRMSSATAVVFLKESNYMVVASFGRRSIYLYQYDFRTKEAVLLQSCQTEATIDLLDYDAATDQIVLSNFLSAIPKIYKVDVVARRFSLVKEMNVFPDLKQWNHEACFHPSMASQVVVASSNKLALPETLMIRFYDYQHDRVLADFYMNSTVETAGYSAKAMRVIDDRHVLVAMSSYRVLAFKPGCLPVHEVKREKALGRIVLVRLDFELADIVRGHMSPLEQRLVSDGHFTVIDSVDLGVSILDGMTYSPKRNMILVADQLNDCIQVIRFDRTAGAMSGRLQLVGKRTGYIMPHGVSFSEDQNQIAVTCYGDNSVIVERLKPEGDWSAAAATS
jgi:hypothetical protein